MSETNNEQELVEQIYTYTIELKQSGKSNSEIREILLEKGMDEETSDNIISNVDKALAGQEDEGSGISGWLVWILILVGINVLSYIFDWPFWIY